MFSLSMKKIGWEEEIISISVFSIGRKELKLFGIEVSKLKRIAAFSLAMKRVFSEDRRTVKGSLNSERGIGRVNSIWVDSFEIKRIIKLNIE